MYIHVHGKRSCKEDAGQFAAIAGEKGYQTLSFDLPEHGQRRDNHAYRCDVWNGIHELSVIADYTFQNWKAVSLFACSLGAYFSLNAYSDRNFAKCLFQSPVLDMEYLIRQMFIWFHVTEERLRVEKKIPTPVDLLHWDYFQYVLAHPIKNWNIPTAILYGAKDDLQSIQVIRAFAQMHPCELTVSETSGHPFLQAGDAEIVADWLRNHV